MGEASGARPKRLTCVTCQTPSASLAECRDKPGQFLQGKGTGHAGATPGMIYGGRRANLSPAVYVRL